MSFSRCSFSCFILTVASCLSSATAEGPYNVAEVRKSVVYIQSMVPGELPTGGTGFFMGDGVIYTNRHVISESDRPGKLFVGVPKLDDPDELEYYPAKVVLVAHEDGPDFAAIKIASEAGGRKFGKLPLTERKLTLGQDVAVLGYPTASDEQAVLSFNKGSVSSTRVRIDGHSYYQTDAAVNPGNSGGPLLNKEGEVCGIVTLKQDDGDNIGYALYLDEIKGYLEDIEKRAENINPEPGPIDASELEQGKPLLFSAGDWEVIKGSTKKLDSVLVVDANGAPYWLASEKPLPEDFLMEIPFKIEFLKGRQFIQRSQVNILRTICVRFGTDDITSMILEPKGVHVKLSHSWMVLSQNGKSIKGDAKGNTDGLSVMQIYKQDNDITVKLNGITLMSQKIKGDVGAHKFCIGGYLSRLYLGPVAVIPLGDLPEEGATGRQPSVSVRVPAPMPRPSLPRSPGNSSSPRRRPGPFQPKFVELPEPEPGLEIPLFPQPDGPIDSYGAPLPEGAVLRIGTTRLRLGNTAFNLQFGPDARTIASCDSQQVCIWDTQTGDKLRTFDHSDLVGYQRRLYGFDWSPNGKQIVTAGHGSVRCWDVLTGKLVQRIDHAKGYLFSCVSYSPDGSKLATVEGGRTVCTWEVSTGNQLGSRNFSSQIRRVEFAKNGQDIYVAAEKEIYCCDSTSELLHFKSGGDNWLRSFTLSPLGDMLAYTENKRLLICDAATANVWHQVDSPSVSFRSFTFRSDQKHLAYSLADRSIRIYDLQRRQQVHALNNIPGVMALCYSPDGSLLAGSCISGRIRIWNTKTWTEHVVDKGPYCSIASMSFSPDGKSLATAGSNSSVSLWSTNDGKRVLGPLDPESMQGRYGVNVRSDFVKITPDGKYLLAGGGRRAPEARCWSLPTGKLINRFSGHTYPASGVSTDLAGEFMISIGKPTRLWRLGTNESVRILGADIGRAILLPDGTRVLTTSSNGKTCRLIDVSSGRTLHEISFTQGPRDVAMSPHGYLLAVAHFKSIDFYELSTLQHVMQIPVYETDETPYLCRFSPDGRQLAVITIHNELRVYDVITGQRTGSKQVLHGGLVRCFEFSPDGQRLATGGNDTSVLLWDTKALFTPEEADRAGSPDVFARAWEELSKDDVRVAFTGMCDLATCGDHAVEFLRRKLSIVGQADAKQVGELIAKLDADSFAERESAFLTLSRMGVKVESVLRKAQESVTSREAQKRIATLLKQLEDAPHKADTGRRRQMRALHTLNLIGTDKAAELLKNLAGNESESYQAQLARRMYKDWQRRNPTDR